MTIAQMSVMPACFADRVADAQRIFRALLDAMAHPGRIVEAGALVGPPGWSEAASAAALTLCDGDTPVWLDAAHAGGAAWLRFHCGAPVTADPAAALFAFADAASAISRLDDFALGTDEYPERSTTLVLEVATLAAGGALRLSGPGIDGEARLRVAGLTDGFWQARRELADLFPRGVDLLLVAGPRLVALPRTTRLEE